MYRSVAIVFAAFASCAAPAGASADLGPIHFTVTGRQQGKRVQLQLVEDNRKGGLSSSSFSLDDLSGFNGDALRGTRDIPVSFAIVRDAGRVDCSGSGKAGRATGECRFTENAAFSQMLASRGIGRPDARHAFGLTMVGATRALVDALGKARYQTPTLDQLTGLAALNVSPSYIAELASRGYRPAKLDDLMAFKALDISPAYIDGMTRTGFPGLTADHIVQFKALGIAPEYVSAMRSAGLDKLRAEELVQLKAMDVTPAFITEFRQLGYELPVSKLVEFRALGVTPEFVRSLRQRSGKRYSADDLVKLRTVGTLR